VTLGLGFYGSEQWQATAAQPLQETQPAPLKRRAPEKKQNEKAEEEHGEKEGPRSPDSPGEAADFYRMKRAPQLDGPIPVERYFDAQKRMNGMRRYSTANEQVLPSRNADINQTVDERLGTWLPLGPGNIGGRTRSLLIQPSNPNVMYAGGVAGGVWKTTNGGGTWTPLTDLLPNLAVSSLVMDPKNSNVIYAGTGEGYGNFDASRGAGIFKTSDGGATWTRLAATVTTDFHYVNDLVISPVNSARVYAATRTGVWRSLDAGATWTKVFTSTEYQGCLDMVIRTDKQTDYIFVSCGNFDQAAIYRNIQAESSNDWVQILTEEEMGRTSLALAPSNQNIVYAASASLNLEREDALHAVFRSNSSGDPGTWTAPRRHDGIADLNTALFTNAYLLFSFRCTNRERGTYSQGWYDNVIAVDPVDPERVWVGGIDLFRSDDGGATWGLASYWWLAENNEKFAHADHHVIAFHPQYNGTTNQMMFVANDGGVQRTETARAATAKGDRAACDPNLSLVKWKSLNNNYGVTQFYHGTVYPNGTQYLGGTQDNGTQYGADSRGINGWYDIYGGDGGYVAVDPNNVRTVYGEYIYLSLFKTTDNGTIWRDATYGITESENNFLFITPFTMDPAAARRLWIGGRTLWRTKDKAEFWTAASVQLAASVSAIGVSPKDGNRVLAGVTNGTIYRSTNALTTDAATTWASTRPRTGYVSWLTWDPVNPNVAYATYSSFNASASDKHVYKSTDAGATWTAIDGTGTTGIPDIPVHCILVDPRKTNVLYVGTDLGVFVSTDGGANWLVENTGFANVVTESLAFNSSNGLSHLYAFTHGRGAFKVRLSGKSAPEILWSASPTSTPLVDQAVTITATVRAQNVMPTGKLVFRDNFNDEIIRELEMRDLDASGIARITLPANSLQVGWHYISVDYSGDAVYNPVRSNELELFVRSNTVDLSLRKTVNGVIGIGANCVYTLYVRNTGNSPNTAPITVTDTLPQGMSFVSHAPSNNWACSASGQVVTCTYAGTLAANVETSVNLTVAVGAGTAARVTNTATCSTLGDINLSNNTATLTSEVKPGLPIDLSLTKSHTGTFVIGAQGTYRINVKNNSIVPTFATFKVEDTLPNGFSFVSGVGDGWTCSAAGQLVTCTFPGVLNAGATTSLTLTVAVAAGAAESSVNRACVIHPGDINAGNNCANDTTLVRPGADLQISKSHVGDFGQGSNGVYTLTVRNNSVAPSSSRITVTDDLPVGMRYVSATGVNWMCSANGQLVTCTNDTSIPPLTNSVITLTVAVAQDAPGFLTNTARCANANDTYLANNTSGNLTKIVPRTDLAISLSASSNPAIAGAPLTYTASVRNGTGTPAENVEVLVTLPTGVSPQTVNPPAGWTVSLTGNSVKFNRTQMAGNEVASLPFITRTNPAIADGATLVASFRVTTTTSDIITNNNIGLLSTRFITRADLAAALRVDGRNPALEADLLTYTLTVTNGGPSVALAVVAASKLSPGLVIQSCTPLVSGTCTPTVDGVNVTYPSLNAAATATVTIVAKVVGAQATGNVLTHNVNVSTTTTDQALTNNIATVAVNAAPAQMRLTIDGGKTAFDFAALATIREMPPDTPSQFFTVENLGVQPLDLTLAVKRTGTDVTNGKIGNADDGAVFPLYLQPLATGSETAVTTTVRIQGGVPRRFRLRYQPLIPAVVNGYTNLAAAAVLPENLTSSLMIAPSVGTALNIPVTALALTEVKFIHPTAPRLAPQVTIVKNGFNEHIVTFSAHDPNGDVSSVSYQFLDQNGAAVGAPTSFPLNTELAALGVLPGQSFTVTRKFANASSRPTVYRVRITLTDRVGNVVALSEPVPPPARATIVSAANYKAESIANGSIVSAFGAALATNTAAANARPLPTALLGSKVTVIDSAGVERLASLFFVSTLQINFQVPEAAAAGAARAVIVSGDGAVSEGTFTIAKVGPALFTFDASGKGLPAGVIFRLKSNGAQSYEAFARYDTTLNKWVAVPIDFGTATGTSADKVFLILFGSGLRGLSGLQMATAKAVTTGTTAGNPVTLPVLYAGPQGDLVGLDQVNLQLPNTLKGRNFLDILLTIEGKAANTVSITVK
jgi:uncharacterized protein (TIGR03437 family)